MKKSIVSLLAFMLPVMAVAQAVVQDTAVRKGTLRNGLSYYIRHNAKDPGIAEFYIAQRVGSILEEPRQRGLAHFLEHMAFNGTEHFRGDSTSMGIVPWCETVGIKFGTNLNAYTSIDQTVYNISAAPISREGVIDSCLLILHDWSHSLLLEGKEIDKERGVVHEEWRTRRAGMAMQRMMEQAIPVVFKGSKYEDCMPIGSMEIVDNFPYQDLRDYYHKWYRPDLQGIIVVGDIDVDKIEQKIKALFGKIPAAVNPAERIYYPVDNNEKMIVTVHTDKEQPVTLAQLYMKHDATPDADKQQEKYLHEKFISWAVGYTLNTRLEEIQHQPHTPFLSASARDGQFSVARTKDAFSLFISCKPDDILGSIAGAVKAAEQMRRYGMTKSELERAKKFWLNSAESDYAERNDRRNSSFVNQCVENFLENEPITTVEYDLELARKLNKEVTLDEVNQAIKGMITNTNQVLALYAPEKESVVIPKNTALEHTILAAQSANCQPYNEPVLAKSLIKKLPKPGKIVAERNWDFGAKELTLSNGIKVYVKPTQLQADDVSMHLFAEGGTALYPDSDAPQFSLLTSAVKEAGVGQYDAITLGKMLTGKIAEANPYITHESQGISGTSSMKDIETMFQLTWLYFTQPRYDKTAFDGLISRTKSFLANRNANPSVIYRDSLSKVLYGDDPRMLPVTQQTLEKANYDRILQIYKERFSDASQFRAVIVGSMSLDSLRPLLCQYLASLPVAKQKQGCTPVYPAIRNADETRIFTIPQGTPSAMVTVCYTAELPVTIGNDTHFEILQQVLRRAYTESVREEKGGTYGVSVSTSLENDNHPSAVLNISFRTDPAKYKELIPIIYSELQQMAEKGPDAESLDKAKKYLLKTYGQSITHNNYWALVMYSKLADDIDYHTDFEQVVNNTTIEDVKQMAQKILAAKRRIEVTMLSE